MSEAGVPLEEIARLVGHGSTKVTETVYRKQLRPVLTSGAEAMDALFEFPGEGAMRRASAPVSAPLHRKKPLGLVGGGALLLV